VANQLIFRAMTETALSASEAFANASLSQLIPTTSSTAKSRHAQWRAVRWLLAIGK
jgi:hypothetical protein